MNTFPYDSWAAATEAADSATGYFTFGPGGNTASVVISLLAIVLSVTMAVLVTVREDKVLNEAADRLADKYS